MNLLNPVSLINRLKTPAARRILPGFLLWLACAGFLVFVTTLVEHPQDFGWSTQYGWTGRVSDSSISQATWLGQAFEPGRPISRIGVQAATYGKPFSGPIEALILKGPSPPKGGWNLWSRRLVRQVRTGFEDGGTWWIDLGGAQADWTKGYYLLFRGLEGTAAQPFNLWLDQAPTWTGTRAQVITQNPGAKGYSLRPAGGHLALQAGYWGAPSLLQGVRLQGAAWSSLLYLACLGLGLLPILLTLAFKAGRRRYGRSWSLLFGKELTLHPTVEWGTPIRPAREPSGPLPLAENQKQILFFFLLLGLLVLGLGLKLTGLMGYLPMSFRAALGVVLFMICPGFIIFSLISLFQAHGYDFPTMILLSCSLGMSSNFVANALVFALPTSLATVFMAYLVVMGCLLGVLLWRLGPGPLARLMWSSATRPQGLGSGLLFWGLLALGFIIIAGLRHYPGLYIEELVILRKILENELIRVDNTAFMPGEITTYIFIPFYLFLALVAHFSEVDVLQVSRAVWPMLSLISLLALTQIVRRLTGDSRASLVVAFLGGLFVLAVPLAPSAEIALFLPTPDRYGISAGLFIPLAVFHFLLHLDRAKGNAATFIGLVYLITEMSFIHSRETLFFLAFILIFALVSSIHARRLGVFLRAGGVISIVVLILLVYREVNLRFSPELFGLVREMGRSMWQALGNSFAQQGPAAILAPAGSGLPLFPYDLAGQARYQGYAYLGLAAGMLPLYAILSRRSGGLILAAVAASFGLFWMTDSLKLLIGGLVGSWFIFEVQSFLAFLLLMIFADLVGRHLPDLNRLRLGPWRILMLAPTLAFAGAGLVSLVLSSSPYIAWSREAEFLLYFGTLAIVAAKVIRRPAVAEPAPSKPGSKISLGSLVLVLVTVLVLGFPYGLFSRAPNGICGSLKVHDLPLPPDRRKLGRLLEDLDRSRNLVVFCYTRVNPTREMASPGVIEFIRSDQSPAHVWLGPATLPVVLASPQYSPLFTSEGLLIGDFVRNHEFKRDFLKPLTGYQGRFDLALYWSSPQGLQLLGEAVGKWSVDRLIAGPFDYEETKRLYESRPSLRKRYDLLFDDGRFMIFGIRT